MPIKKYNWLEMKLEYIRSKEYKSLKDFIKNKIGEEAFKKNGNYKTHIWNNIKTWNKEKENFWRDFIRDSRNLFKSEDYLNYYLAIKQLIDFFPKLVNAYIKQKEKDIKSGKRISINELLKYFEFIAPFMGIKINKKCKENKNKSNIKISYKTLIKEFNEVFK